MTVTNTLMIYAAQLPNSYAPAVFWELLSIQSCRVPHVPPVPHSSHWRYYGEKPPAPVHYNKKERRTTDEGTKEGKKKTEHLESRALRKKALATNQNRALKRRARITERSKQCKQQVHPPFQAKIKDSKVI